MRVEYKSRMKMLRGFAIAADLVLLNACLWAFKGLGEALSEGEVSVDPALPYLSWNLAYLICMAILPPTIGRRSLQSNDIARNCFRSGLVMVAVHYAVIVWCGLSLPPVLQMLAVGIVVPIWMFCSRMISRALVRTFGGVRQIVYVGNSATLRDLVVSMKSDLTSRYHAVGYFAESKMDDEKRDVPRLGGIADIVPWLEKNACDELYCATGSVDERQMRTLFDYCENHLIRFYGVPDSRRMLDMRMVVEMDGDIPIFMPRAEPLHGILNRIIKREFDFVFSALVLMFLFPPVLLVVAIMIKRSSPGPIFFTQWRDGLDGQRFKCIKFRSMHANGKTDGKAAMRDDPRKFPFGDFMRRKNIDELPQFINVFFGDMSVVGPRPHVTWTTDAYRDTVNKYMVRLYAKPGITGWAQVNGCRGETKTDEDMARRIKMDVWYIGHWSFWLDLRIIVKTVTNMLFGDKGNAY